MARNRETERVLRARGQGHHAKHMGRRPVSTTGARSPVVGATLGQRILAAMQYAGLRKAHLAERVGVTWASVNNWTSDEVVPGGDNLRRIAEVTGVTLDEILGVAAGQDPPFPAWKRFLEQLESEGTTITPEQRRALASIAWPPGEEPTLSSYQAMLAGLRVTKRRES